MMEFSCFSNSPNGPTAHTLTHTHTQCKDSHSSCLCLCLSPFPATLQHVSEYFFYVFPSIFFYFCMNFLLWFLHSSKSERERAREAAKLVTFLIYQQYANDAQFKAYNRATLPHPTLSPSSPQEYLHSLQFHLRFNM